jgi:hypothetical protein
VPNLAKVAAIKYFALLIVFRFEHRNQNVW